MTNERTDSTVTVMEHAEVDVLGLLHVVRDSDGAKATMITDDLVFHSMVWENPLPSASISPDKYPLLIPGWPDEWPDHSIEVFHLALDEALKGTFSEFCDWLKSQITED
jgi:hypothetical protein